MTVPWKAGCAVALVLMLAACRQAEDLSPRVTAPPVPAAYGGEPSTQETSPDTAPWLSSFGDAQMEAAVERAMTGNLSVEQARQRLIAAKAIDHSSIAAFVPGAAVSGSATGGSGRTPKNDFQRRPLQLDLDLGWEIALFGQARDTQASSRLTAAMTAADMEAAKVAVAAEVAANYVHLRALQQTQRNLDDIAALLERKAAIATTKQRTGLATGVTADALQSRLAQIRSERASLTSAVQDAAQRIATLQGTAFPDPALLSPHRQPTASGPVVQGRPADLLRLRPDVRRAQSAALQTGIEVGLAQADLYPKLRLSGTFGIGSPVEGSLFGLMGGPSLQIPIFDYGKREDVVAARRAQFGEAISAYRQTVLVAYEEASRALLALEDARARTEQARSQIQAAKRAEDGTRLLVREGLAEPQAELDSRIASLELQHRLIASVEDEGLAAVAFYKATGAAPIPGGGLQAAASSANAKN